MQHKALVVGMSQYSKLRSLESFANNANAIAEAKQQRRFEIISDAYAIRKMG